MSAVATIRPLPPSQADGPSPRKRRKRAPAAGAADDCFTCANRGYKCDRRRPYCSQCLDDGKDCSGYKTQLTWGVGVASRGKLRGLSLPVAGTKKAVPVQKPRHRPSASVSSIATQEFIANPKTSIPSPASSRSNVSAHRDQHSISPPLASPFPTPWETPAAMPQHSTHSYHHGMLTESPVSPLAFAFPPSQTLVSPGEPVQRFQNYHHDQMSSIHSVYPSPASDGPMYSHAQSEKIYADIPSYSHPPQLSIPIPPQQMQQSYTPFTPFDTAFDRFSPYASSFFPQSNESYLRNEEYLAPPYDLPEAPRAVPSPEEQSIFTDTTGPEVQNPRLKEEEVEGEVEEIVPNNTSALTTYQDLSQLVGLGVQLPASFTGTFHNIGSTPRLQYLINYYAEVISPVIVAFDSPSNPFRTHILRLASDSEALQHAVGALAASNLRQRRSTGALSTCKTDPARRSSLAHLSLSKTDASESWDHRQAAQEETTLKNHATALLNYHLSQPVQRLQDSTLAVLLILCLFHMCDTGVAKFSTQFKGVRKLLALRKASGKPTTKEGEFCTRMFAWWDGVTSSVNEREGVFGSALLSPAATLPESSDDRESEDASWSLEHLAGIDTSLFRIISRLGRLNMLAQGGDVEKGEAIVSRPPRHLPPRTYSMSNSPTSNTDGGLTNNLNRQTHYTQFDGNGWLPLPLPSQHQQSSAKSDYHIITTRSELFHRELAETQHLLSSWSPPYPASSNNNQLSPTQQQDLTHISLTFYHATQLYLLRLQYPTIPSPSPAIQQLVHATLAEVDKVKADVYLLWPLFIAGSECTSPHARQRVLKRVGEIQGDSGFVNNGAVGGVLEGVWRVMDGEMGGAKLENQEQQPQQERGFRWAEVMRRGGSGNLAGGESGGGEYIVV